MTNDGLYIRAIIFSLVGAYMIYMGSSGAAYMMLTGGILLLVAIVMVLRPYLSKYLR